MQQANRRVYAILAIVIVLAIVAIVISSSDTNLFGTAGDQITGPSINPSLILGPPEGLSDTDFISVNGPENYVAAGLREGESAQEFYFDDLMGLAAEEVDGGYQFTNQVLLINDSQQIQNLSTWADSKGARPYLVDAGDGSVMVFRNSFRSQQPGDPVINSSSLQTSDDTNLCGYIAVSYIYNGLTGSTDFTPLQVILAQTTLPAGRGLTTFFPALPPLAMHLGGITARDLSIVSNVVLEGTGYVSSLYRGLHSDTEIRDTIIAKLQQGLPVLAIVQIYYEGSSAGFRSDSNGVLQTDSNYGHFVVVTGIVEHNGQYVYRIRNPYDNRTEYYAEADFMSAIIKSDDTEYTGSLILFDREEPGDVQ